MQIRLVRFLSVLLVGFTLFSLGSVSQGMADTTGFLLARSGVANGAGIAWTTPENITANDGLFAEVIIKQPDKTPSNQLFAGNFAFNLPLNAVIEGIEVGIYRRDGNGVSLQDNVVQLTKDGTNLVGDNLADTTTSWPQDFSMATYGGTNNLWNTTWTPDEINNPTFGVAVQVKTDAAVTKTARVDYIQISVTYRLSQTTPPTPPPTTKVPIMDGWWLLLAGLSGVGLLSRRRK